MATNNARTHYEAMAREAAEQSAKVDVLASIKRASQLLQMTEASQEARDHAARRLELAVEVLKELIEAAREYREGTRCHVETCVYCHERSTRLDVALARAGGAA